MIKKATALITLPVGSHLVQLAVIPTADFYWISQGRSELCKCSFLGSDVFDAYRQYFLIPTQPADKLLLNQPRVPLCRVINAFFLTIYTILIIHINTVSYMFLCFSIVLLTFPLLSTSIFYLQITLSLFCKHSPFCKLAGSDTDVFSYLMMSSKHVCLLKRVSS